MGQLLGSQGVAGTSQFEYGDDGRLAVVQVDGQSTRYTYDPAGRVKSVDGGITVNSTAHFTSNTTKFDEYTGRRASVASNNGTNTATTTLSYDAFGRTAGEATKNAAGTTLRQTDYAYDGNDNVTSKATTGGISDGGAYVYDKAGRLTSWTPQITPSDLNPQTVTYTWDVNNNRTKQATADSTTIWTYDSRNRPTSQLLTENGTTSTTTIASDPRGAITGMSGATTRSLSFDAFDQLIGDGGATNAFDALGRLVSTNLGDQKYAGLNKEPTVVPTRGGNSLEYVGRSPSGSIEVTNLAGIGRAVASNTHDDSIGYFSGNSPALIGANAYSPFGVPRAGSTTLTLQPEENQTEPDPVSRTVLVC